MAQAGRRTAWLCSLGAVIVCAGVPAGAAASVAGAPAITSATAGQQRITVVFTKPQSDGGSHISSYRVTCRSSDGGAKAEKSGLASPITVGSVSVGKHYTCTVAAKNSAGFGTPSAPSAVVVPLAPPGKGLPDPPTAVSARPEIESIRVAFKNVHISGGAHVTGYLAICTSSDGGRQNRHANSITPITVKHLTAGKTYTCTVRVRGTQRGTARSPRRPTRSSRWPSTPLRPRPRTSPRPPACGASSSPSRSPHPTVVSGS